MGKRGLAPTPTAILEARGSWRAKINKDEPIPNEISSAFVPDFLTDDEKVTWNDIAPQLINLRVMTNLDWRLLERYCVTYHKWKIAVRKPGAKHSEIDTYASQLLRIEGQLGMTPSSRSSIKTAPKQEEKKDSITKYFKTG